MAEEILVRRKRKPHNASVTSFASFGELLEIVANEPRKATMAGQEVTMTRREALLRLTVERALQGKTRELMKLLQMMAKDPKLAVACRVQMIVFLRGGLADC